MSTAPGKKPPEVKKGPPGWIVSFSDMVTLLLAFFVLLQSFAHMQDPDLFYVGRDSFRRAINSYGLPGLLTGRPEKVRAEYKKNKYTSDPAEHDIPPNRLLDAEEEEIREKFRDLSNRLNTKASDITDELVDKRVTPISFPSGRAELDEQAQAYLTEMAVDLRQNLARRGVKVYVIGLASDLKPGRERWLLSAKRAGAVEKYLRDECAEATRRLGWQFISWGTSDGGSWRRKLGRIDSKASIVIVVTKERN